jgi:hypothetical protein
MSNSRGYLKAHFTFPAEYSGTVTANFKAIQNSAWVKEAMTVDRVTGICDVPVDMIRPCKLYIWLSSTDTNMHIPTNIEIVEIGASGEADEVVNLPDPTINQYEETVRMYNEIMTHGGTSGGGSAVTDSDINGNIVINGIETNVYTHPVGTNPHGTTKEDVSLGNVDNTSDLNKPISNATQTALNIKADLDVNGKVLSSQLPSYVDDVIEGTLATFPTTGESGKIYVDVATNISYRWSGSVYVEISPSIALGETASTAYRGDRGKTAYDHSQTTGNPHGTTKANIGLGSVDNTSDLDKPISTAGLAALNTKLGTSNIKSGSNVTVSVSGNDVTINAVGFNNQRTSTPLLLWAGTQAQYTALGTYDSNTVYLISG